MPREIPQAAAARPFAGFRAKEKAANSERLLFSFGEGIFCFLWGVTKNYI